MQTALTYGELSALMIVRRNFGRNWKSALRECWMTGNYPLSLQGVDWRLQRIRNEHGPSWLTRFRFPVDAQTV